MFFYETIWVVFFLRWSSISFSSFAITLLDSTFKSSTKFIFAVWRTSSRVCVCTFIYALVTYSEGKKNHIWRTFSYYLSIILQLVYCHSSSFTSITHYLSKIWKSENFKLSFHFSILKVNLEQILNKPL